jgi:hypothetical protein
MPGIGLAVVEIRFEGAVTRSDLREAIRLNTPKRLSLFLFGVLFLTMGAAAGFELLTATFQWARFLFFSLFTTMGLYLVFLVPLTAHLAWRTSVRLKERTGGCVTAEGIALRSSVGSSEMKWDGMLGYRESSTMVLLYGDRHVFFMMARSLFAGDEDWEAFRRFVHDRRSPMR